MVRKFVVFLFGIALISVPVLLWDSLRWSVAPSPWDLSVRNYGQIHLVPISDWVPRLQAWMDLLWYFTASNFVWMGAVLLASGMFYRMIGRRLRTTLFKKTSPARAKKWLVCDHLSRPCRGRSIPTTASLLPADVRFARTDKFLVLILGWSIGFLLLHTITSIQIWDRYLLPLVPIWALVAGWLLGVAWQTTSGLQRVVLVGVLVLLIAPPALNTVRAEIPVGGDRGAYDGLDQSLRYLQNEIFSTVFAGDTEQMVLYHRELGWQHQFYLYDEIRGGSIELRWFPHATHLVDNVIKTPHKRTWLLIPDWSPVSDLVQRAAMQRVRIVGHANVDHMRLVELVHEPLEDCEWCLCQAELDENRDERGNVPGTGANMAGYPAIRPPVPGAFNQLEQCTAAIAQPVSNYE